MQRILMVSYEEKLEPPFELALQLGVSCPNVISHVRTLNSNVHVFEKLYILSVRKVMNSNRYFHYYFCN